MKPADPPSISASPRRLPGWAKGLVSALVVVHLVAVVAPPLQLQTYTPGAPATPVSFAFRTLQPYIDLLYLNHGYAFFAPDPGPSHLVRWRATFADDRPPVEGIFPDPKEHWPRLYYHRHFMLSEQLHSDFAPLEGPPPEAGLDYELWKLRRDNYVEKWAGFEKRLNALTNAEAVALVRIEHRQPDWYEHQRFGLRLNDPSLYATLERDVQAPQPMIPEIDPPRGQVAPTDLPPAALPLILKQPSLPPATPLSPPFSPESRPSEVRP